MDAERDLAERAGPQDEVVWGRVWERRRLSLPAVRGWRPGRRTFVAVVLLFALPSAIGGLANVGTDLSFVRNSEGGVLSLPGWLRMYYGAQIGLSAAAAVVCLGCLVLLLRQRAGAAIVALGALVGVAGDAIVVVAYVRSGVAPAGSVAEAVAEVVSKLVLLGLALLLLLPRREAATGSGQTSFAPPAP